MARPVETEHSNDCAVAPVDRCKLAALDIPIDDLERIKTGGSTSKLNLAVVLIAPEPWHRLIWPDRLAVQQPLGRMDCLCDRVVPMLNTHSLAEVAVGPLGDVTGSDHARCSKRRRITHHTVLDVESAAFEPFDVGNHADAHDDQIGVDHRTVGKPYRLDVFLAHDGGTANAEP